MAIEKEFTVKISMLEYKWKNLEKAAQKEGKTRVRDVKRLSFDSNKARFRHGNRALMCSINWYLLCSL